MSGAADDGGSGAPVPIMADPAAVEAKIKALVAGGPGALQGMRHLLAALDLCRVFVGDWRGGFKDFKPCSPFVLLFILRLSLHWRSDL